MFLVDAFTNEAFKGNPAGVCILKNDYPNSEVMQNIAKYYNWSEIAFIKYLSDDNFAIRWFSPLDEAKICGHATLASSYIIFNEHLNKSNKIQFESRSGKLFANYLENNSIALTFPLIKVNRCEEIVFNIEEIFGTNKYTEVLTDGVIYIVVLNNYKDVFNITPNFDLIKKVQARAIAVTAKYNNKYDFCSRYFAPSVGIYEDPVCGSLHCRLAYYWSNVLNKKHLVAYQASKRSGILNLLVDNINNTVQIIGNATITAVINDHIVNNIERM